MTFAQATAPDLGFLQGLDPGVAYAALAVITIGMFLFYLGPGLRDWLSRRSTKPVATAETQPALPTITPPAAVAVDRAADVTARYLAHLEDQLRETERERTELARRLERVESELDRVRWRRGGP